MSRYVRLVPLLAVAVLLGSLTACKAGGELPATPTKTPVPLVEANPGGPTATPAPFYTPTPEIIAVGPDSYPPNVNPLTGLTVDEPAVLERRPLAVKISNSPPEVRPQAGLNSADLIFEHYAEGGVTRFTGVFWTNTPERVGSVRSCRLLDLEVTLMYDSLWSCSGSSVGVGAGAVGVCDGVALGGAGVAVAVGGGVTCSSKNCPGRMIESAVSPFQASRLFKLTSYKPAI